MKTQLSKNDLQPKEFVNTLIVMFSNFSEVAWTQNFNFDAFNFQTENLSFQNYPVLRMDGA